MCPKCVLLVPPLEVNCFCSTLHNARLLLLGEIVNGKENYTCYAVHYFVLCYAIHQYVLCYAINQYVLCYAINQYVLCYAIHYYVLSYDIHQYVLTLLCTIICVLRGPILPEILYIHSYMYLKGQCHENCFQTEAVG